MSKKLLRRNPRFTQTLLRWHRRVGLISALFVILLVVTGIPLHHAAQLGLTDSAVKQDWLLDFYGIKPPEQVLLSQVGEHRILQVEDAIYLDRHFVANHQSTLIAGLASSGVLIAVTRHGLLLMSEEAELVDQIELPIKVSGVSHDNDAIYLSDGRALYRLTEALDDVEPAQLEQSQLSWLAVANSVTEPNAAELVQQVRQDYRSRSLNWERVVLDLHSGRLFGSLGPWIMDIAALLFLLI
jgi:hypothetical protein